MSLGPLAPIRSFSMKSVIKIMALALSVFALSTWAPNEALAEDIVFSHPTGKRILSESPDFPTQRFSDPWNMNSRLDLSRGEYMNQLKNVRWKGGRFTATTTGGDPAVHPLFPGYLGNLPNGRDGIINRIQASKFNRFSIRMYSSRRTSAQLFWFYNQTWDDFGVVTFAVERGWGTYIVNPRSTGAWRGKPIGLRLDPTSRKGGKFSIDWMRLYQQKKTRVKIAWRDSSPGQVVNIYVDNDKNPNNGHLGLVKTTTSRSSSLVRWDPSPWPRGIYYFYIKKSGQAAVYSKRVKINAVPLTIIVDPDDKGGQDYAKTFNGKRWNMSGPQDIEQVRDIRDISFSNGIMSGISVNGDGFFHLPVTTPIDTNRYHRLTFRFRYEGAFDYGLGTMSRFIWSPDHNDLSKYQTIKDIVVYPGWTTYVIDLKKAALSSGNIGWNGQMTDFRFDPLEVPRPRRFFLDYVRLAADDQADRFFIIKWRDAKKKRRPTLVNIYFDNNRSGFNGIRIVNNRKQRSGVNRYTWNTSRVPAGSYWIYTVAKDGVSTSRRYSKGPLLVTH